MKRLLFALLLTLSTLASATDFSKYDGYHVVSEKEIRYAWYNPRGVPQDQLAHIIVVRDKAFFESSMRTGLYCDDYVVTDLMQGEVVPFNVRPGEHKLTNGFGSNLHNLKINVQANHYYLFKLVWDDQRRGYNIVLEEESQ